ncbi:hypothetical protein Pst134EB_001302 [Puccinia striiformis f. sp. tritici]|nr:hypothetical protein Pst134EB_001302 [Puccinia striiformis f. sp. tritici]
MMDLSTWANHAQRLSARLSENLAERTKDLGLDAEYNLSNPSNTLNNKLPILAHAQGLLGNSLPYWERLSELTSIEGEIETKRLLGSKSESDRVEGLKRVTAIMCRNRPVLSFFPFVTNCLHPSSSSTANGSYHTNTSHSFTIRNLVSIYILQHSHLSPDLALLSVNAWQKDLSDSSPIIRSLALKTLAGMGLDSVLPLVVVTINRLANDPNWFVKRTVAEALITVHLMDPDTYHEKLIDGPIKRLLQDRSPLVIGAALTAWEAICPKRWDLLHKQFRAFSSTLIDADENGQHVIMRILTRYVRQHFTNPEQQLTNSKTTLDLDLELFLNSVAILFQSRNPSVVIAATNVFLFLAPLDRLKIVVPDLMRLVEEKASEREDESLLVVLHQIYQIIKCTSNKLNKSHLFLDHLSSFTICSTSDSEAIKMIKLKILRTFISLNNRPVQLQILSELKFCTQDFQEEFVKHVIWTIGQIVTLTTSKVQQEALNVLIGLVKTGQDKQRCKSVEILRALISSDLKTIAASLPNLQKINGDLIQLLVQDKIKQDSSRANIYRLVSEIEFRSDTPNPNFIYFYKYSISNFVNEGLRTKFQIMCLVSKSLLVIMIRRQENDASMSSVLFDQRRMYQLGFDHLMRLARYDSHFIIRDRARFLEGLLTSTQGLTLLEDPKGFGLVEVDEHDEDHNGRITLMDEQTAFTRGHQFSSQQQDHHPSNPMNHESMKKISLKELHEVLFLDHNSEPLNPDDHQGRSEFEANSLFHMSGSNRNESCHNNSECWKYLDWNTIPAWSKTALDPRLRDPEDGQEKNPGSSAQISSSFHQRPSNMFRASTTQDQTKLKEKVVLIPTGSDDESVSTYLKQSGAGGSGHRNLEDFLQSSADEDEGSQDEVEDESEEDEQEDGDDDDESESEDDNKQ